MIRATNQLGFNVEVHTPEGWRATGYGNPHATRELAAWVMTDLQAAAPGREFRVYPALADRRAA